MVINTPTFAILNTSLVDFKRSILNNLTTRNKMIVESKTRNQTSGI